MLNFDHFIAVDWALRNMAIARATKKASKIHTIDVSADITELKIYLKNLKGSKILTFEETNTAQWLYTELKEHVDEIIICDPYRNSLLKEGEKNDKIDAQKLVKLLKAELLKPVFHSNDDFIYLRKIVSGYEDLIKAVVRLKNQRAALFRANQLNHKKESKLQNLNEAFVLKGIDKLIKQYQEERSRYEKEFRKLSKRHKEIKLLESIPGIGLIGAVKIIARVIDAKRFNKGGWLSYCGLVKKQKISGGKIYGSRQGRYCTSMKSVFKTASLAVINGETEFGDYYRYLLEEKNYPVHQARHAVSRRIATISLGVLKAKERFKLREFKNKVAS